MPIVMQPQESCFIGLLGLAVNTEFNYPNYFVDDPVGAQPEARLHQWASSTSRWLQNPKPKTVAIVAADQEFLPPTPPTARARTPRRSVSISSTTRPIRRRPTDYAPDRARDPRPPIRTSWWCAPIRRIRSAIVRAVNEIGLQAEDDRRRHGGAAEHRHEGPARPAAQRLHQPTIFWLPVSKLNFPGVDELMKKYQAAGGVRRGRSARLLHGAAGLWPQFQVLAQAIAATKTLSDDKLADYIRHQHLQGPCSAT